MPSIGCLEQPIPGNKNRRGVMRRNHHRRIPIPTIRFLTLGRFGPNRLAFIGGAIDPAHATVLRFSIDDTRVRWIYLRLEPVAALHNKPFIVADPACRTHAAWTAPSIVVLQAAAHVEWCAHV